MKQTKGAIGNLLNRYKAVLKKCHLLNTFGSLAVASMLVMGGAEVAGATSLPDTLTGNISLEGSDVPFFVNSGDQTLDLNGYQITTESSSFEMSSEDKDAMIVVKRGSSLTIDDITGNGAISGDNIAVAIKVTGTNDSKDANAQIASLIVNGGTIKGGTYAISGNGNRHNTYVEINDGNISSKNLAIYHPQDGKMVINGGKISGDNTGIEMRSGDLTITGGEISGRTDTFSQIANGGGPTTTGAALAISQHTTDKDINVTISGGKFTGYYAVVENDLQDNGGNINLNISDGEFDGKIYSENIKDFITGGTFTDPTALHYLGEGANVQVNLKNDYSYKSEEGELNADKAFEIEENRTVNINLNDHTFTLTKDNNTSAGNVTIVNGTFKLDNDLTLTGGVFNITEATLEGASKENFEIGAGAALNMTTGQVESLAGATLDSGGTVNVIGDGETEAIKASDLASKFGTSDQIAGIVNVENATVDGIFNEEPVDGHVAASNVVVMGIATEQTRNTELTESNGSDVSGAWKKVLLAEGVTGDLRVGSETGSPSATATVTLGDANAPNKGTIGNVVLNAGSGNNATLRVVGNGQGADFTIGNVRANSSTNAIEVAGATLHTGNITTDQDTTALHTLSVDHGDVLTDGSANVQNVVLTNYGTFTATSTTTEGVTTGGEITINGTLSGQGLVRADEALTFNGLTTADGDDLRLEGKNVSTGELDSTAGKVTIVATENLTTTGGATLNDDVVLAQKWTLDNGDTVKARGNSYQLIGQFATSTQEDTTSTLDTTYTVEGQSMLVHVSDPDLGNANETALGQLRAELDRHEYTGPAYLTDQTLNLTENGKLVVGSTETDTTNNKVVFGDNSVLVVDAGIDGAVFTATDASEPNLATAYVDNSSKLYVENATAASDITIFGNGFGNVAVDADGWKVIKTDTDMLKGSYEDNKATFEVQDAGTVFPGLSEDLAPAVNDLYNGSLNAVDSESMGIRFLSRATNNRFLGSDKQAAAATIESAARMAFAGAVPQMTKMASDSATNSVVNRMGFANPENGAKAMNMDGKLVDDKALGLALWIAPLWSNQNGFGMEAGNLDYGYNANIGGISLGADYTWDNNFRAGLMFNIGGGYAESSGDLSETTNSMTFWGVGAYGGWKYENFAVMGDVSYTSTWNSVDQDVDHRMEMGDLEADIQASAISAGLRFEYKLETQYLDLIPHVGARYMSINTWGYDVETNGGTVLEGDGFQQNIWTFPVGITFSKELEMNNDWYFKPSVDFTVIPAAGDIKAKEDVLFTGMQRSYEVETQMMDYFTWQGGLGLEFGNDNMSVGVNYTLQAGQNSTGHGVFGMFRYEF